MTPCLLYPELRVYKFGDSSLAKYGTPFVQLGLECALFLLV
jgi:hypothetical protein